MPDQEHEIVERVVRIDQLDRSFDIAYWQSQSPEARAEAAWQLVVDAWVAKGRVIDELRLQRSIEAVVPAPR